MSGKEKNIEDDKKRIKKNLDITGLLLSAEVLIVIAIALTYWFLK